MPNLGQILRFLEPCDLEIWRMTFKNNRAPLLSIIKLYASFHHHMWIQTGVTVRKRLSWVLTSVTLTLDLWPWPFAWTSRLSLVITPENFMMIRWWEHSQKGVTDRQTDRQTEKTIHRAAWSQLKNTWKFNKQIKTQKNVFIFFFFFFFWGGGYIVYHTHLWVWNLYIGWPFHSLNVAFIANCFASWLLDSHISLIDARLHTRWTIVGDMTQFDDVPKDNNLLVLHREYTLWRQQLNGQIFRVATGPLWGESTGDRWIPLTKANDMELWSFLWSAPEQTVVQTTETPVIWDAVVLIMTSLWWLMIEIRLSPWLVEFSTGIAIVLTSFAWDVLDTVGRGVKWDMLQVNITMKTPM